MKKSPFVLSVFIFIAVVIIPLYSCEKSDYYDDSDEEEVAKDDGSDDSGGDSDYNNYDTKEKSGDSSSQGNDSGNSSGDGNDDNKENSSTTKSDTLTVAQFIDGNFEGGQFVKGYIVGDCTRSFKNAEFEPPFTHEPAILIADELDERDDDYIVAVKLGSGKYRTALNLVDHPEYHKRVVILFGYRTTYLNMAGIDDLGFYELK